MLTSESRSSIRLGTIGTLLAIAVSTPSPFGDVLAEGLVAEPDGYRMENYDDVVPDTLKGATVVEAAEVRALRDENGAVLVDVIPEQRRPDTLPAGQLWIPVPHQSIPGSIWLPDVGYGGLSQTTEAYFFNHLKAATNDDKDHDVVFYCRANCWMSWNAARRAVLNGYTSVYWFAEGTDGWFEADYGFETATPAPGKRQE